MENLISTNILNMIDNKEEIYNGVHNIRNNGELMSRATSKQVDIESKENNSGLNVTVKPDEKGVSVHIPVILTNKDFTDTVNNTINIGENSDVTVIAGCGVHNSGESKTMHDGVHKIKVNKGAKLKYIEKHYAEGSSKSKKIFNTKTYIEVEENGNLEMELVQIKGVDNSEKDTEIILHENAHLLITERIFTEFDQKVVSNINIEMVGKNSSAQVVSRSVAKDSSKQVFNFNINGKNKCSGHVQCDSIIMNNAQVTSIPALSACNEDAALIHEAAIGKIASQQLLKLMSLGLTEEEAQDTILKGFLK